VDVASVGGEEDEGDGEEVGSDKEDDEGLGEGVEEDSDEGSEEDSDEKEDEEEDEEAKEAAAAQMARKRRKDATVYQKDATMATPATTEVKKDLFLVLVLSNACGLVG
jgi:hypothetical protein